MEMIQVSPEMLTLIGSGLVPEDEWPTSSVAFIVDVSGVKQPPTFRFHANPTCDEINQTAQMERIVLIVATVACERVRGASLSVTSGSAYLLNPQLREIAHAIRDCELPTAAALPYRLAKSIELFCEIIEADRTSALIPVIGAASCSLSAADRDRIAAARKLIEDRWNEPLTLDQIARQCGINRGKLCSGFRELYGSSVADTLSARRLDQARRALLITDLPVGIIGYQSGYQSNASFTRAFGRRFGVSPSELRGAALG